MKLINNTGWRTDQLRALISRVAEDELSSQQRKILRVTINYQRRYTGRMGSACLGTPFHQQLTITLLLPRTSESFDRVAYALIIAHEMAHCRGWRHRQMTGNRYDWKPGWQERYAYAYDYPIEQAPAVERVKPGDDMKHAHAMDMMLRWSRRVMLDTARLKKWQAKAYYYEKKMAAKRQEVT